MKNAGLLPPQFAELEGFVEYWVRDTNDERWQQRSRAPMVEIEAFYKAALACAEEAAGYLESFPLHDMPPDAERLLKLLLGLAHAAIAVEMHGQPRARHATFPQRVHVVNGPAPYGGSNPNRDVLSIIQSAEEKL